MYRPHLKGKENRMLLLSRHKSESIMVGNDVEIFVIDIHGGRVRLGIKAPKDIPVHRREIFDAIERSRKNNERKGKFLKWKISKYFNGADKQETNTTGKKKKYRGAM
jgi:carbon storage regulator